MANRQAVMNARRVEPVRWGRDNAAVRDMHPLDIIPSL